MTKEEIAADLKNQYGDSDGLPWDEVVERVLAMKAAEPLAQGDEAELMKGARDIPTPRSGGGMVAPNLKSTPVGGRAPADLFRWLDGDNRKCCCRGRAMAKEHIADLEQQIAALVREPLPQGDVEQALSAGRTDNPYADFSDEAGAWNEGYTTAWGIARAALVRSKLPIDRENVAKALCRHEANRDGHWFSDAALEKHILNNWRAYLPMADAAITAIGSQSIELRTVERKPFVIEGDEPLAKDEESC